MTEVQSLLHRSFKNVLRLQSLLATCFHCQPQFNETMSRFHTSWLLLTAVLVPKASSPYNKSFGIKPYSIQLHGKVSAGVFERATFLLRLKKTQKRLKPKGHKVKITSIQQMNSISWSMVVMVSPAVLPLSFHFVSV